MKIINGPIPHFQTDTHWSAGAVVSADLLVQIDQDLVDVTLDSLLRSPNKTSCLLRFSSLIMRLKMLKQ